MVNKNRIKAIIYTAAFALILIAVLYGISPKTYSKRNNFNRLFTTNMASLNKYINIKFNSFYVAGADSKNIYLGNYTNPALVLLTNYVLSDTLSVKVKIQDNVLSRSFKIKVDSPNIIIMDGVIPGIMTARFDNLDAIRYTYDSVFFTLCVPISKTSFILRTSDIPKGRHILTKETSDSPHILQAPNLLEKQVDGFFCTDGTMNYSKELYRLVYTYFYRNEFTCIDTNLNLIYKAKTIDTVSKAQIGVAFFDSGHKAVMDSPPLLVNKRSCVSGSLLYIYSTLKANNDSDAFYESSAIDVYSLNDGKYKFSFYLHDIKGKKINDFFVYKDKLIAIQDQYLAVYKLNFQNY